MNAQLESNKIKQTIIQSLDTVGRDVNMEDKDIDLGIVRKGLRDFENDLADIRAFEKHFAKAEAIIILHDNLQKERQDLSENAHYLGESYLYFQEKIKNVTTEF